MNFNPQLSSGAAIALALLAGSMWGTWFISLKYLGAYPLDGFFVTLFSASVVFVWTVGLVVDRGALAGNIMAVWDSDPLRIVATYICGGIYVVSIRFQLSVFRTIGLSLAQPIQSAIATLISLTITVVVGGVPTGTSIPRLVLATLILICAVMCSMLAGYFRSHAQAQQPANRQYVPMSAMWRSLVLVLIASLLSPAYPFALSFGLHSITQPNGLAVLPYMAILASGAFTGSLLSSGIKLTRRGEWNQVWAAGIGIHKFGIWSGLFHYGGNIIHTFAASFLSAAIAFPLGITSGLWTQMWGIVYGELKGSPLRAYIALISGVILYVVGAYIIATGSR
jgi:hypothetical protein